MPDKNQYFEIPITEVIKSRSSVRTYNPEELPADIKEKLQGYAQSLEGPFNPKARIVFLSDASFLEKASGKVSTYGIIKGASFFAAGIVEEGNNDLEQLGYIFEKFVLYATSLGLGTCWLGGTFNRSNFEKATKVSQNERLPVITPIGYEGKRKRILDSFMKAAAGSKKRLPWNQLFFNRGLDTPLTEKDSGPFFQPLEMLRWAPSASNRQPWRVIKDGPQWHFYKTPSGVVNKATGFELQRVDMGIAMCHFELTAKEKGLPGEWSFAEKKPAIAMEGKLQYIVSWK